MNTPARLHPVSRLLLEQAAAILADREGDAEVRLRSVAPDEPTVQRLIGFVPEAFALVLLRELPEGPTMTLPDSFSARLSTGEWRLVPMTAEPIFSAAGALALDMYKNGSRQPFETVAGRSSIIAAIRDVLNKGGQLEGLQMGAPALLAVPAESYGAAA
ncbi:hypothetical protein LMIY3S_05490 [Labrys miyagiensis]